LESRREQLAAIADHNLRMLDAQSGKELAVFIGHRNLVTSVAWSPDGKRLATGSRDNTARVWEVHSNESIVLETDLEINHLAWSPDGKRLTAGFWGGRPTPMVWDAKSGRELQPLRAFSGLVSCSDLSKDGKRLAVCILHGPAIKVLYAESGREILTIGGIRVLIYTVAWSPDGKRLAAGNNDNATVWDAKTGKALMTLSGITCRSQPVGFISSPPGRVTGLAWSPDGKRLAVRSSERAASVWNVETGKVLLNLDCDNDDPYTGSSLAWSPDGRRLVIGEADGVARVWDMATGKVLLKLSENPYPYAIASVAWSPDGKRLASGSSDNKTKVWDADTGEKLLTLSGQESGVISVAWSPDGKRLASASQDGTIRVYAMDIHDLMALARERVTAHPSEEGCKEYLHVNACPPFPSLPISETAKR
jgi:WD40 repeat protein